MSILRGVCPHCFHSLARVFAPITDLISDMRRSHQDASISLCGRWHQSTPPAAASLPPLRPARIGAFFACLPHMYADHVGEISRACAGSTLHHIADRARTKYTYFYGSIRVEINADRREIPIFAHAVARWDCKFYISITAALGSDGGRF